ncbi:MAG: hypothetical protein M3313_16515 [Actinomycetota bacterium]|nr:hypothetical protein [Actinomycetota bacterium]
MGKYLNGGDPELDDPYRQDLTRRIDAAIAEVYRSEGRSRAESRRAMHALGAFGAPAVDRVLELYRSSAVGPREHAWLLNGLGSNAIDAQVAARRAVARACPHRYVDRLHGGLDVSEINVVADVHDLRITPLLITRLGDADPHVRQRAAIALVGRIEGRGDDDRRTRDLAEQAVIARLEDDFLPVRAVAAYAVARRSRGDGILAYQQILRPTEPETLAFVDVQQRIAALRRGESLPPPL